MGKQYAFWRKPDGSASTRDDPKYVPRALLKRIGVKSSVVAGHVQWPGVGFHFYEAAIQCLIVILRPDGTELDGGTSGRIVRQAISDAAIKAGGGKPLSATELLEEIDRRVSNEYRRNKIDFVLVTSLSTSGYPAKPIRVGGCEISPIATRLHGKYAVRTQVPNYHRHKEILDHYRTSKYQLVRVRTAGCTEQEAIERGLGAVNYLRGILNHITSNQWRISFGSTPQPIGLVHLGALHSLHNPDGAVVSSESFWYERGYKNDHEVFAPKHGWEDIEALRRHYMRRINSLPYSGQLKDVMVRYAFALDESDHDLAFMHLWRLIERITDTIGGKYDETIRRAAWIFADHELPSEMLSALRTRRNAYVHSGTSSSNTEPVAFIAKSIVDPHIECLVNNSFNVSSLKEYGDTLALPMNPDLLLKRSRRLAFVAKKRWPS